MEIFNRVIDIINNVFLVLCSIAFAVQIIYVLFFWLKPKKYPPAKTQHKFGIIIPARNEEEVIGDTVRKLFEQNYPRELYDVFVVAHNCTDKTAERAKEAGAIVFCCNDDDPKHRRVSYALQYGFRKILAEYDNYEAFIRFDADNLMNDDFIARMNDAFDSGVKIAKCFENSKNIDQNVWAGVSGLYYIRDSRIACHVRSALHTDQMLTGAGMMVSADILRRHDGWKCMGVSEDAEFTLQAMLEGERTRYVPDAIVYEDQPSTLKDTVNRNKRMGNGLFKLFFTHGLRCFGKFFTTFRFGFLDLFLTLLFVPIAVVACTWFPLYYGYKIIAAAVLGDTATLVMFGTLIGYILLFAFYLPFTLQSLLAALLERKRINAPFHKLLPAIFLSPLFMIVYAISICLGVFSRPTWKKIARNVKPPAREEEQSDNPAQSQQDEQSDNPAQPEQDEQNESPAQSQQEEQSESLAQSQQEEQSESLAQSQQDEQSDNSAQSQQDEQDEKDAKPEKGQD